MKRLLHLARTCCAPAIVLWLLLPSYAQVRLPQPPDEIRNVMAAAEAAVAAGNFAEAVDHWQRVVETPEDFFDAGGSLRLRAETALLELPPEGRAAYERRYGAAARGLLHDALRQQDLGQLSEVVRRYFATEAGRDAALALAERLSDRGEPLAAARIYDRLMRHAAVPQRQRHELLTRSAVCWWVAGAAQIASDRLRERDLLEAAARPEESSGVLSVPSGEEGLEFLARHLPPLSYGTEAALPQVTMFRGNPRRNGSYSAAVPVGPVAWQRPSIDQYDTQHPERAELLQQRIEILQQRHGTGPSQSISEEEVYTPLPAGVPLVAQGIVVYRGPGTIKAVSLETGELLWSSVHIDDTFHHLVDQEWQRREEEWHRANLDLLLVQRMWRDLTAASLSTDGRLVYTIADGGMVSSISQSAINVPALAEHPLAPHPYNRLLAFDLKTGLLEWELGGPPVPFESSLAGAFFLGAPLPLDGELYCLVEDRGQVQVVAIDPETHAVTWRQALYNPDVNFSNAWLGTARRMAGLSPTAAGDILICPTGETTVVTLDRRTRTLLWSHAYQAPSAESPQQALAVRLLMARQQPRGGIEDQIVEDLLSGDQWADCLPVVAGQYVLLTPPDSQDLICLRLLDGEEVWRHARVSRRYIAAVHDETVVLVGREQVEALNLEDGRAAWSISLNGAAPAGRGFRHGQWYVLPLSTGDAATIDLSQGKLIARTSLPESCAPGNFVAAEGRILVQTSAGVYAFRSFRELTEDIAQQLAARDDNPDALYQRGAIRLHLGETEAALQDLRKALQSDPASPARGLLAATLIEGLRTDFASFRHTAPEIEQLVSGVAEQALFHRLFAEGLQRSGEVEAAFQQYLRFADYLGAVPGLQKLDTARSVRGDRWIRGRLEELIDTAGPEEAERLRSELARTVDAAIASGDPERLARLHRVVPRVEERRRIELAWAEQLSEFTPQLETILLSLLESDNPEHAAYATARLADGWLSAHRNSALLNRLVGQLSGPLAETVCLDEKTGATLVSEWREDAQRASLLEAPHPWPTKHVTVLDEPRNLPGRMHPVRHFGPRSELMTGWTFYTDPTGSQLAIFDSSGRPAGQVQTATSGSMRGHRGPTYIRYITTWGRYLLIVVEDQWTLVDVFASDRGPTVIGSQRLISETGGPEIPPNLPRMNVPGRIRMRIWVDPRGGTAPLGNVGPVADGMFVYQAGPRLNAVSVSTGELLWTHDVPGLLPGGEIMQDERHVIVWPNDSSEPRLFRASDGMALGKVRLPPHVHVPQPDGCWGTGVVTLDRGIDGSKFELGMYDLVRREHVWQRSFEPVVDWRVLEGRDFLLLFQDGHVLVVDGLTGADRLNVSLEQDPPPVTAAAWSDGVQWFVAGYSTPPEGQFLLDEEQPLLPVVHGTVLAVSCETGEVTWRTEVEYQQWHTELPGDWPFLMFAALVSGSREKDAAQPSGKRWMLLLLDKQTGRILFESTATGRQDYFTWASEPDKHRVHLSLGSLKAGLEFDETPPENDPGE